MYRAARRPGRSLVGDIRRFVRAIAPLVKSAARARCTSERNDALYTYLSPLQDRHSAACFMATNAPRGRTFTSWVVFPDLSIASQIGG